MRRRLPLASCSMQCFIVDCVLPVLVCNRQATRCALHLASTHVMLDACYVLRVACAQLMGTTVSAGYSTGTHRGCFRWRPRASSRSATSSPRPRCRSTSVRVTPSTHTHWHTHTHTHTHACTHTHTHAHTDTQGAQSPAQMWRSPAQMWSSSAHVECYKMQRADVQDATRDVQDATNRRQHATYGKHRTTGRSPETATLQLSAPHRLLAWGLHAMLQPMDNR